MRLKEAFIISVVIMLLASVFSFSQSRQTGAIQGRVADDQGSALPGANLTLTSPNLMGVRTFVSDSLGEFRFPALPPGVYTLKAELQGFVASVQENIRLTTTVTLTVDFSLHLAKVAEQVTVIAKSPTVDVKSTETASVTLGNEILRNIPYSQFTSDIVNLARASMRTRPTAPRTARAFPGRWTGWESGTPREERPGSSSITISSRRPRSWASGFRPSTAPSRASFST